MRVNSKRIETVLNILVTFVKTTPLPLPLPPICVTDQWGHRWGTASTLTTEPV